MSQEMCAICDGRILGSGFYPNHTDSPVCHRCYMDLGIVKDKKVETFQEVPTLALVGVGIVSLGAALLTDIIILDVLGMIGTATAGGMLLMKGIRRPR